MNQPTLQSPPPVQDSVSNTVAAFHLHSVVPVRGMIHLTGLSDQSTNITITATLADTGANCCLCKDESKLVNVQRATCIPSHQCPLVLLLPPNKPLMSRTVIKWGIYCSHAHAQTVTITCNHATAHRWHLAISCRLRV